MDEQLGRGNPNEMNERNGQGGGIPPRAPREGNAASQAGQDVPPPPNAPFTAPAQAARDNQAPPPDPAPGATPAAAPPFWEQHPPGTEAPSLDGTANPQRVNDEPYRAAGQLPPASQPAARAAAEAAEGFEGIRPAFGGEAPARKKPKKEKVLPALRRKRLWKKYRWTLWLLVMVPVVYFVVQLFVILSPRTRTEVVKLGSMTDSLPVTGQVVLESMTITAPAGSHVYYTVPNGQRVTAETEVAMLFAAETGVEAMDRLAWVEEQLAMLDDAEQTVAEGGDLDNLLGQMQSQLYRALEAMEMANYSGMDEVQNQLGLVANKMQMATGSAGSFDGYRAKLQALQTQYQQQATPQGTVAAAEGGYFAASPLGDRIPLSYEEIAAMTPVQAREAFEREPSYYGDEVVGHIVTDYKWFFFTTVTAKQAERFVVGDKSLRLSFPEYEGLDVPVQVNSVEVDEKNDLAVVELYCDNVNSEVLALRVEHAEVVFGVQKGIRIPKEALRLVDVVNDDGSVNTYRGVYVEFGNMVYFKRVEILIEDDYYMLVPATPQEDVSEVALYDVVVVDPGGVELYDRKIL